MFTSFAILTVIAGNQVGKAVYVIGYSGIGNGNNVSHLVKRSVNKTVAKLSAKLAVGLKADINAHK